MFIDILKTLMGKRVDNPNLTNGEDYEKKKKIKWGKEYGATVYYFELFLKDMICIINGIDKEIYIDEESLDSFKMKFNNDFRNLSLLDWDSEIRLKTNDKESRAKFLTLTLFQLLGKTDKTIRRMYQPDEKIKYKKMYKLLMFYIKTISDFIVEILNGEEYTSNLLKIEQFIIIRKRDEKAGAVMKKVLEEREKITDMISSNEDDRKIVNHIMSLAYLLSTYDINGVDSVKNKKKKELNIRDEDAIRKRLFKTGSKIIKYKMNNGIGHPKLYKKYVEMHTKFYSKFEDINERVEMNIAVKALDYLKFILNDKLISKYINKMVLN